MTLGAASVVSCHQVGNENVSSSAPGAKQRAVCFRPQCAHDGRADWELIISEANIIFSRLSLLTQGGHSATIITRRDQ